SGRERDRDQDFPKWPRNLRARIVSPELHCRFAYCSRTAEEREELPSDQGLSKRSERALGSRMAIPSARHGCSRDAGAAEHRTDDGREGLMKRLVIASLGLLLVTPLFAGDWPQFRGPGGRAVGVETGLPESWGPTENLKWKAPLPGRGVSGPVI